MYVAVDTELQQIFYAVLHTLNDAPSVDLGV